MAELPKLHSMLNAALERAVTDCSTLLGHELAVRETSGRQVGRDAYFGGMEDASFLVGIESQGEYPGMFHLVLSLRDAIVLSGLLLGVPAARVTEKKKLAIVDTDDADAFAEIANQVTGSFNAVFKPLLPRKVHLKQLAPQKFIPGTDRVGGGEPVADGDYYLLEAQLAVAGHELEPLDILIPLPLANIYDLQDGSRNEDAAAEGETGEAPAAGGEGEPAGAVLILEANAADRQLFQEILAASGVKPVVAALDADLAKVLGQEGVKAVVMGVGNADDWELSLCGRIKSHCTEIPIPVIVCARQWTRTGVLKALKYGAREVMLKPCPPDELAAKVTRLMKAA